MTKYAQMIKIARFMSIRGIEISMGLSFKNRAFRQQTTREATNAMYCNPNKLSFADTDRRDKHVIRFENNSRYQHWF